jgi:hypothetical protein
MVDRELRRRPAAGIETVQLAGLGVIDDGEQVASHAVHHGLDDTHCGVGRHDRVDRIPATSEDRRSGLGRKRVFRGNDSAAADDHRASLRSILRVGRRDGHAREGKER